MYSFQVRLTLVAAPGQAENANQTARRRHGDGREGTKQPLRIYSFAFFCFFGAFQTPLKGARGAFPSSPRERGDIKDDVGIMSRRIQQKGSLERDAQQVAMEMNEGGGAPKLSSSSAAPLC